MKNTTINPPEKTKKEGALNKTCKNRDTFDFNSSPTIPILPIFIFIDESFMDYDYIETKLDNTIFTLIDKFKLSILSVNIHIASYHNNSLILKYIFNRGFLHTIVRVSTKVQEYCKSNDELKYKNIYNSLHITSNYSVPYATSIIFSTKNPNYFKQTCYSRYAISLVSTNYINARPTIPIFSIVYDYISDNDSYEIYNTPKI